MADQTNITPLGRRPRVLAKQLDVAPRVIYEAVAKGEFGPVWRLGESGKSIVIPEAAVQAWLASKAGTIDDIAA